MDRPKIDLVGTPSQLLDRNYFGNSVLSVEEDVSKSSTLQDTEIRKLIDDEDQICQDQTTTHCE